MEETKQIKLAFVGCGGTAQAHWRGIQARAPQISVTAAVDTDPERAREMAEQTGGHPFTSLEGKPLETGPEYSLGELRTALAIYRSTESRQ